MNNGRQINVLKAISRCPLATSCGMTNQILSESNLILEKPPHQSCFRSRTRLRSALLPVDDSPSAAYQTSSRVFGL